MKSCTRAQEDLGEMRWQIPGTQRSGMPRVLTGGWQAEAGLTVGPRRGLELWMVAGL